MMNRAATLYGLPVRMEPEITARHVFQAYDYENAKGAGYVAATADTAMRSSCDVRMKRWRTFDKLTAAEKAYLARYDLTSTALEICCLPGRSSIAVVMESGRRSHWAVFGAGGECCDEGFEDSRDEARKAAAEALRLWSHRCAAAGNRPCLGFCLSEREEPGKSTKAH